MEDVIGGQKFLRDLLFQSDEITYSKIIRYVIYYIFFRLHPISVIDFIFIRQCKTLKSQLVLDQNKIND